MVGWRVPRSHPRYHSLVLRERLVEAWRRGIVVPEGLIAHGRGECFDYLIGEETQEFARRAARAAAALLLLAEYPVISVNGNTAALAARDVVLLAEAVGARIEVNLFYRTEERARKIAELLRENGAKEVLGVDDATGVIPGLEHARGRVSPRGILRADVVLVALEDGDRTEALRRIGKKVIAIDLNPLSRTARAANISIVDNVVRALPEIRRHVEELRDAPREELEEILRGYSNEEVLGEALRFIAKRLTELAEKGITIRFD
ncbi:4-phosphopantoate--beta-alanine ligase [Pyrofollis japonicus]|uniref:4-phosphopantoate--beta-alanine ligase n=1 Tax=Pyrofollis japonicus TaxID=3060460 RepID=UPI0037CB2CB4